MMFVAQILLAANYWVGDIATTDAYVTSRRLRK
jgi:hypothetical protein